MSHTLINLLLAASAVVFAVGVSVVVAAFVYIKLNVWPYHKQKNELHNFYKEQK